MTCGSSKQMGQAEALNLGEHVPSIVASRQSDDGALVVLKEVFRQGGDAQLPISSLAPQ